MNLIVIVADTCRQDHLGCYGNEWMHTENLDALAEESVIFESCYTASFPTVPHRADCFLGRYGFPCYGWGPLPRQWPTLAETLTGAGYVTQLIHDTPHFSRRGFNYERGFQGWRWIRGQESDCEFTRANDSVEFEWSVDKDRYDEDLMPVHRLQRLDHPGEMGHHAPRVAMDACRWLEMNHKADRFFLWVDMFDPHEPWDAPDCFTELYFPGSPQGQKVRHPRYDFTDFLTPEELEWSHAAYCGELTLVDKWIGAILRKVGDLGLLEDTAIVFTSDHGFLLGEHGRIGKHAVQGGPWPLYEEVVRVPLLVRLPDGPRGDRKQQLVQPVDLCPTLLELAEVPVSRHVQGRSLVPILDGKPVRLREIAMSSGCIADRAHLSTRATITHEEGWSLILGSLDQKPELYYLPADPEQAEDRYEDDRLMALELAAMFRSALSFLGAEQAVVDQWKCLGGENG
ncbi:sulfatase [bacterium]|nr:sulfatase [bacterium]